MTFAKCATHTRKRDAVIVRKGGQLYDAVYQSADENFTSFVELVENVWINLSIHTSPIAMNMLKSKRKITSTQPIQHARYVAIKWASTMCSQAFHHAAMMITTIRNACKSMPSNSAYWPNVRHAEKMLMAIVSFYQYVEFFALKKMLVRDLF